jgi:thiamine pyrophosphate-dependent acetolactate synthase large subunit-like protein
VQAQPRDPRALRALPAQLERRFPNRFSHAVPDPGKKTIIQCTVDTLDINRSYETRHAVIGDAKLTRQALIDELSTRTGGGRKRPAVVE